MNQEWEALSDAEFRLHPVQQQQGRGSPRDRKAQPVQSGGHINSISDFVFNTRLSFL